MRPTAENMVKKKYSVDQIRILKIGPLAEISYYYLEYPKGISESRPVRN